MASPGTAEALEALAADIGDNIYMDIAKWHLYLGNAKLHTHLAEKLYPFLQGDLSEAAVNKVLQDIPVALGGGRRTVPLIELLPSSCQTLLMDILEDAQRQM